MQYTNVQDSHPLKVSHGNAMKRICHYLQGTKTKGMILSPSKQLTIDCFVYADFAGQWNVENPQDPLCVKSCTGYILMVGNCLVHWVSKLQSKVAVSTMEAKYIAQSTTVHDLIPLQTLVDEVKTVLGAGNLPCHAYWKVFEDNNGVLILATTPQMTPRSRHIAIKYHFLKEHVHNGNIQNHKVTSKQQVADCMTKGLEKTLFKQA